MLFGSFVVCLCGLHFVVEASEVPALAVAAYLDVPFLRFLVEAHAFVLRGWVLFEVYAVVAVLPVCCRSQVSFSIVEAIMVDVIDVQVIGQIENLAVHQNMLPCALADTHRPVCVTRVPGLIGLPFVLVQMLEIVRIDDSILALGKGYPAKGIAVAEAPIAKRQNYNGPRQPVCNRDGEIESDNDHPP